MPLGKSWGQSKDVGGAQGVSGVEIRLLLHLVCQSQVPVLISCVLSVSLNANPWRA